MIHYHDYDDHDHDDLDHDDHDYDQNNDNRNRMVNNEANDCHEQRYLYMLHSVTPMEIAISPWAQ